MKTLTRRDKLILAGLYLSRFDEVGLQQLGFSGFVEAFNALGFALGAKPSSIKNYRDEFDPMFPNPRKGWHGRTRREYCMVLFDLYKDLDLLSFTELIQSFFEETLEGTDSKEGPGTSESNSFAQRLITGLAAERYFEAIYSSIADFDGLRIRNTTRVGCGYDFELWNDDASEAYFAVEVKGLSGKSGSISLTPKEYSNASLLDDRFYLFVARNFCQEPSYNLYRNPLRGPLSFSKVERVIIQTTWITRV